MAENYSDCIYKVKVNRTGAKIPVYESVAYGAPQIGTIYPNEVFSVANIANEELADYTIRFRNSAGKVTLGVIYAGHNDENVSASLNLHKYAMFTKTLNGKTYYGFNLRRSKELYNGNASYIRTLNSGIRVLTEKSQCGVTHPEWMNISYYETSAGSGLYTLANGGSAFLDVGFDKGSTFTSNCSLIGSM